MTAGTEGDQPLAGQVALVTGASRGLGAATSVALARAGAHVVAIARTVGGLEATDDAVRTVGGSATLVPLDLLKLDEAATLGPALFERFGRLDIFVANAAILGALSPSFAFDPKAWDRALALNLQANQRLTATLHPLLRASPAGQAVYVTDRVAREPAAYWGGYAASKAALEAAARVYAAETATSRIRVHLFDPGPMATALRRQAFPGEDQSTLPSPDAAAARLVALLTDGSGSEVRVASS